MENNSLPKLTILEKIFEDATFANGELYKSILKYLFACYNQKYMPSEIDIAVHVFGKKNDFDPAADTLVRVYLYRLRKKLDSYYNGLGKHDKTRLSIPKGHYYLEFIPNIEEHRGKKSNGRTLLTFVTAGLILILIVLLIISWKKNRLLPGQASSQNFAKNSFLWSDFIKSDLQTSFVIGELFAFYLSKNEFNHEWLIRDDQINSYDELNKFANKATLNPSDVYLPGWDIIPKEAAINLLKIKDVLAGIKTPLDVKITSEVTLDEIRNSNIIYLGHFHNLGHLKAYLPNKRVHQITKYSPGQKHPERFIRISTTEIDTLYQFSFQYSQESAMNHDFVLLSKVPGPNDNTLLFIVSFLPLGRLEIVKMLTDKQLLSQIESEILSIAEKVTPHFELLIEVKGYREKGFEMKIKHFFPLPQEFTVYN